MYERRLNHCKMMAVNDKLKHRKYWKLAAEVYTHLINCEGSHSIKKLKTGVKVCKEI